MKPIKLLAIACLVVLASGRLLLSAELVSVVSRSVTTTIDLPGEFEPFQSVAIHARVQGYIDRMLVDRGSIVKRGELLAVLTAPEMATQLAEAESKLQSTESERLQAEAQLTAVQSTSQRLKEASATPGAIAGNELVQVQQQVEAATALAQSRRQAVAAARAAVQGQKELAAYLRVTAPFNGVVTERLLHPGALVGSASGPLLILQDVSRLRLVVALPEQSIDGTARGTQVEFHVPAYPQRQYSGTIARLSQALDSKTRTMAVELDVQNRDRSLLPGMYPSVQWPVHRARPALLVPRTSIVTTTERTFVIRNQNGRAEWVNVARGTLQGDLMEVSGNLQPGDKVVRRATDEMREGTSLNP